MVERVAVAQPQVVARRPVEEYFPRPVAVPAPEARPKIRSLPDSHERPNLRSKLSRYRASFLTALGWPRGFFIQYPYAAQIQHKREPYPEVWALCDASPFREFLEDIRRCGQDITSFGAEQNDPVLGRGMFSELDGVATYAAVRRFRPKRILEIGSGDSTFFLARGVKDNGVGEVTCIDPKPRREISDLGVNLKRRMLAISDVDMVAELNAGDVLFIDSSHIMLPNMDVDIQLNRMFPRLRPGVIVHLHDIFLPDNYPRQWRHRNYSEQNALIGWLVGGAFEIIWPASFVYSRHNQMLKNALGGICDVDSGGSLWLRKS